MDDETMAAPGVAIPEDLSAVDDKGLASAKQKIMKAYERLDNKEKLTSEELTQMGALVEQIKAVRAEEAVRAEAQEAAKAQRAEYAAILKSEAAEAEAEAEVEETESIAEVVEIAPEATAEASAPAVETIAAAVGAVRPVSASRTQVKDRDGAISIVAAGARNASDTLDRDGLSVALHDKARTLNDSRGTGERVLVASIKMNSPKNDVSNVLADDEIRKVWSDAHNADSLVASGGWCAPSETIYDFVCDFEAMPEMVDLPSITSTRGGIRFPVSPSLGDVMDDVTSGFTWTEANDIAAATPGGPTKPCFKIPCPDFDEVRLQAQGICLTAGNLTDRAYPELTNRYVDLLTTAHAHRMNALTIAKMEAASIAVAPTVVDLSAAEAILAGIELQIVCARDHFFMAADAVLEVVLPRWARTVIRRDLARRSGVTFDQISNSDINTFFSEIGARVQFVSDWQSTRSAGAFDGCLTLPASLKALVYPAGAHTRLDGGSIDLGVVRDSTLNATNDFTAAWTEEFWGVVTRCFSLVVTIPVCADGSAGALKTIACPTA